MDEQELFAYFKKLKNAVLLDYLHAAFQELNVDQRRAIFTDAVRQPTPTTVDGNLLRHSLRSAHSFAPRRPWRIT